jgi:hypothetical protein
MANLIVGVYAIYLIFITIATVYVAKTLFTHSKVFMHTIFNGRVELANSTNKLFETGFFLLAFGIGLWYTQSYIIVRDFKDFFELLSEKAGAFTLFLGIMLMFNLYLFFRGMKYRRIQDIEGHPNQI